MKNEPGPFEFKMRLATMFLRPDSPCLYFVQEGADGPVKIGLATCSSLESRLISLQIGNPRCLRFAAVICLQGHRRTAFKEEGRLHAHFAAFALRGEWFELCGSIRSLIEEFSYEKYGGQLREYLRGALIAARAI